MNMDTNKNSEIFSGYQRKILFDLSKDLSGKIAYLLVDSLDLHRKTVPDATSKQQFALVLSTTYAIGVAIRLYIESTIIDKDVKELALDSVVSAIIADLEKE